MGYVPSHINPVYTFIPFYFFNTITPLTYVSQVATLTQILQSECCMHFSQLPIRVTRLTRLILLDYTTVTTLREQYTSWNSLYTLFLSAVASYPSFSNRPTYYPSRCSQTPTTWYENGTNAKDACTRRLQYYPDQYKLMAYWIHESRSLLKIVASLNYSFSSQLILRRRSKGQFMNALRSLEHIQRECATQHPVSCVSAYKP